MPINLVTLLINGYREKQRFFTGSGKGAGWVMAL
jgi:hypothetical protein